MGAKYRKLASRMSKKKGLIALARILLVSIYHMLKRKEPYRELGDQYLEELYKERTLKRLTKRIESLGYEVNVTLIA